MSVAQLGRYFLTIATRLQQFNRQALPFFGHPGSWAFAEFLQEMCFQRAHGDAAFLCQCRDGPVGLRGEFGPVFNVVWFGVHVGCFRMAVMLQCGQGIV